MGDPPFAGAVHLAVVELEDVFSKVTPAAWDGAVAARHVIWASQPAYSALPSDVNRKVSVPSTPEAV